MLVDLLLLLLGAVVVEDLALSYNFKGGIGILGYWDYKDDGFFLAFALDGIFFFSGILVIVDNCFDV